MKKVYITGDTHIPIDIQKIGFKMWPEARDLTSEDYLIVVGDFGLIWALTDDNREEIYWTKWLNEKPFTTLFIDGNHENFDRLNAFPEIEMFGGKVGKVSDKIFHLKRGEVYTINGQKIFTMGGGKSTDKKHRVEGKSWWAAEVPDWEEVQNGWTNLEKHNFKVDYILTHVPPAGFGPITFFKEVDSFMYTLNDFRQRVDFKKWYFGHMHIDEQKHEKFICLYDMILKLGDDLVE